MRTTRLLPWTAAGLLALSACAAGKPEQVSDLQLARVPPDKLGPVNEARMEVARSTDEMNRQELALRRAENEIRNAKDENKITDARYDQAENNIKNATYVDDPTQRQAQEKELEVLRAYRDVTAQRIRVADAAIDSARADRDLAQARKELAEAKLEMGKYNALAAAKDPIAETVNADALKQRLTRAESRAKDFEHDTVGPKGRLTREQTALTNASQRYDKMRGGAAPAAPVKK